MPRVGAPPHSSPIRYQIFGNVYRHKCQRNLLCVWLVVSCTVLTQPPICIFYLHAGNLSGGKIAGHTLPNYLVLAVLAMVAGLCGARGTGYQEPFTEQGGHRAAEEIFFRSLKSKGDCYRKGRRARQPELFLRDSMCRLGIPGYCGRLWLTTVDRVDSSRL